LAFLTVDDGGFSFDSLTKAMVLFVVAVCICVCVFVASVCLFWVTAAVTEGMAGVIDRFMCFPQQGQGLSCSNKREPSFLGVSLSRLEDLKIALNRTTISVEAWVWLGTVS